jgi:hypothetical protein
MKLVAWLFAILAPALVAAEKPTVWIAPPASNNGASLRELFEHPDQWQETRSLIDVLFYTDLNFNKQFTDDELRTWFAQLSAWHIRLGLEVGAVKEWGQTGEKTFEKERPMWDRIQRLGGKISAIALDEPLVCVRMRLNKPDAYAVEETASYIALVRHNFPEIRIGDIETYPSFPIADHIWWIEALNHRLQELNVRGLDFYRLDVNWVVFTVQNRGSWKEVKTLEQYCRSKALPFSLIYWAAGYPAEQRLGLADDSTWYTSILQQGYDYALIGGRPDEYVIESWVGAPSHATPETGNFTFTRSVRDFVRKFVTQKLDTRR